jgi:hypothetical protein
MHRYKVQFSLRQSENDTEDLFYDHHGKKNNLWDSIIIIVAPSISQYPIIIIIFGYPSDKLSEQRPSDPSQIRSKEESHFIITSIYGLFMVNHFIQQARAILELEVDGGIYGITF